MGAIPAVEMVFPKNSIDCIPNWHFSTDNYKPASSICWNTWSRFSKSSEALWAAKPMSSTYCAHRYAFTTGSKYSLVTLLKADKDLLKPWAKRLQAKLLKQKWQRANGLTAHLPSICSGMLLSNLVYRNISSRSYAALRLRLLLQLCSPYDQMVYST